MIGVIQRPSIPSAKLMRILRHRLFASLVSCASDVRWRFAGLAHALVIGWPIRFSTGQAGSRLARNRHLMQRRLPTPVLVSAWEGLGMGFS